MKHSYKISYGSKLNFSIYSFILLFKNLLMLFLFFAAAFYVYCLAVRYFENNLELVKLIALLFYISVVYGILLFLLTLFLPKRVIIKQNVIRIKRYTLNLFYLTHGFNDRIVIKDIVECKKYCGEKRFLNPLGAYAVYPLNWDDLVEIKTRKNKKYYVPVKNAETFVEEVNNKIS